MFFFSNIRYHLSCNLYITVTEMFNITLQNLLLLRHWILAEERPLTLVASLD